MTLRFSTELKKLNTESIGGATGAMRTREAPPQGAYLQSR